MNIVVRLLTNVISALKKENARIKHELSRFSARYKKSEEKIQLLSRDLIKQKEEVRLLMEKLAKLSKNSGTSSKPPSSDIVKPKRKPKDKGGKRGAGGQKGHPKHGRTPFADSLIDSRVDHFLDACSTCGSEVELNLVLAPRVIQQAEIVSVPIQIEEQRAYAYWCPRCRKYHYAAFPPEVLAAGLFRAKLTAVVAYMKNVCHCSFSNIRRYIRDVLKLTVSRGYLSKLVSKVSRSLDFSYKELLERLPLSAVVNVDETGHKENGERFWTWVFRTDLFVLFKIEKSRGSCVLVETLGKEFNGLLGCDYFSAYRKYMKDFGVTLQFCLAHLIRDVKYLAALPDTATNEYGKGLLGMIKHMFKIIHDNQEQPFDGFTGRLTRVREQIIEFAINKVPSEIGEDGKEKKKEAYNMAKRFKDNGKAYFEFITSPGIDPTNNIAEQAIRFVVIDRIVTQGTRSIKGRKANERLWTVIATCRLRGQNAFNFILKSVEAFFNGAQPPSLTFDSG